MAKTIEKQGIELKALIIRRIADGSVEMRADYNVITSEDTRSRSMLYEPKTAELAAIKNFADKVFAEIKTQEGL